MQKVTDKKEFKIYDLGLDKLKDEIDAKIKYNESILKAYTDRIEFLEKALNNDNESIDRKTTFAIEIAELKHKSFFQKQVQATWILRSEQQLEQYNDLTKDCNERFDETYALFMDTFKNDTFKISVVRGYKNEENDQRKKNDLFIAMINELNKKSNKK